MRKCLFFTVLVSLLIPAFGQTPPGNIAKFYWVKVKPGMEQKYEEAYKKHVQWHRDQNDPWTWTAFVWETGERSGQYVVRTGEHYWADFDGRGEFEAADTAHAQANLLPLVESVEVSYAETLPELSRPPEGQEPFPLVQVTQFEIRPEMSYQFLSAIKKVRDALDKAEWGNPGVWTRNLAGSAGNVYTVVTFHRNWASLKEPETSLLGAVEKILGHAETSQLSESFWKCVKSSRSDLVRYRPDLSYYPGSQ